jgi:iron complex outermembrane receptor protein
MQRYVALVEDSCKAKILVSLRPNSIEMSKKTIFLLFLLLFSAISSAQQDSSAQILDETTVLAQRIQLPFSQESRTIQVLHREQLRMMPVRSISEALQSIPGIDVRQRGPLGIQADLHVRGGGFDQVLVLLNGVRLSDPQTGHHLMNVPVDWSAIERIEVLKGPGARIYGQNAFACAINIVTSTPVERLLKVGLAAGDFGYSSANVYAALPKGRFHQHLAASADFSGGYRPNTDFSILNGFYQASLDSRDGKGAWNLLANFNARKFGANGYYGRLEFTDQYEEVQTSIFSLGHTRQVGRWVHKPRVSWRRNQDYYDFQRSNADNRVNFHLSQVLTAEMNSTARWNNGQQTGLGANVEYTALSSAQLGQRERYTLNLFAEHRLLLLRNRLDLTPGVAFSTFSDFGAFFYPGIDAGYRLGRGWRVYANAGSNYRIPTFTDLYYEDPGNKGNPDLRPERAFSSELGVKFQPTGEPFRMQMAFFRRDGRNLIDWAKDDPADKWETRNYNTVLVQGLELNSTYAVERFALNLAYTYLDAQVSDVVTLSRYTLNHLRHQLNAGIDYRLMKPLHLHVRGRWCDRIVQDAAVKSDYFVADSKLSFTRRRWSAFAEAINLFDVVYGELRYSDTAVLTMPGRWFRAGVEVKW